MNLVIQQPRWFIESRGETTGQERSDGMGNGMGGECVRSGREREREFQLARKNNNLDSRNNCFVQSYFSRFACSSLPSPSFYPIWNDLKNCMFQFQCGATLDTYPLTHPRSSPKGLANFCYDDGSSRENLPWLDVLTVLRCPGCSTCRYKLLESNWIDLNPSFFNIFKKFDKHI